MPEHSLTPLEFPGLLEVVQQYAASALGREFLATLSPLTDLGAIQVKFQEIRELTALEDREGPAPLADFPDLAPWLAKAQVRGSLLPPEAFNDLLQVLRLVRQVRQHLMLAGEGAGELRRHRERLQDLPLIQEAVQGCISPHNFILDEASPALAAVRRELAQTREAVNRQIKQIFFSKKYQDALQSPTVSQRHGRYVIPLKADHKGAIPGIIHDTSQTRATLYLEPLAIVEQNNAINLLSNRERREEEAVLRRLTDLVRPHLEDFRENLAALAELDAIQAKGRFARDYRAREPIWRREPGVDFRQARHPLLLKRLKESRGPAVVPVDLKLSGERRFLIISGANAGGKTVALKTLGLLTLMVQSGIPIPVAEGSDFAPFAHIYADIGDPQDLAQNLSTFSAHLNHALEMLGHPPGRALILLDELGTSTDPTEGGALALALLQAFNSRGDLGAVTTHLPLLKSFAQRQPGFENVAVVFDEETRRPTYRLAYGVVGASNALKIARELGLPPEILAEAEGYLGQEELKAYRLLGELEAAQEQLARQRQELAQRQEELTRQTQDLEERRRELAAEGRRLAQEARQQAQARIQAAEAEFKAILLRLRESRESWGKLRQEFSRVQTRLLQEVAPEPRLAAIAAPSFTPGQQVFLPALGLAGELEGQRRDGTWEVRVRQVKLRVSPEEITPLTGGAQAGGPAEAAPACGLPPEGLPRLNLVGLRVDEALPLVDRLLDQALLHGQERVDIIHGLGTGRLKQAVREHLKQHAAVKAIHADDNPGVTVVDLRQ